MPRPPLTFILAGGGTGGHVFPALAIAGELKKQSPDAKILFVGTRKRIEEQIVPAHGYEFKAIWISGFQRKLQLQHLLFPLKVVVSLIQSFFLIRRFKPSAVIGTGGYVCGPVLAVASALGVPGFIHESNSYPGVTTRLLAGRATTVFLGFQNARKWLRESVSAETVGTPTSDMLDTASREEGLAYFGLDRSKQVVLITGGSQGSTAINNAVLTSVAAIAPAAHLIWQTGVRHFEAIRSVVERNRGGWVGPFVDRMDLAYAAADIIVCRAGATTIAEITRIGRPAILVPYPFAAEDHQTYNARSLVDAGAAVLIHDRDLPDRFTQELLSLMNDKDRQKRMAAAAKGLGRPDAGLVVAQKILDNITRES